MSLFAVGNAQTVFIKIMRLCFGASKVLHTQPSILSLSDLSFALPFPKIPKQHMCSDVHMQGICEMTTSTTMTIRLDPQLKAKLGRLADGTRRSRSFLAAEAVETYVDRELAIIEGIERGLADVEAARTVSHEDAMASLRQVIDAAAGGAA